MYGCGKVSDSCQLVRLLHVFLHLFKGECISGFGPVVAQGTPINQRLQVIIPSFQFNDSGRITAFHLAGICGGGGSPTNDMGTVQDCINILQVWRPSGGNGFSIAANFTATLAVTYNTAVTASVAVDEPIPFSSGDVLGFSPGPDPGLYFQIYIAATPQNQQPASHTYYTFSSFATELSTTGNRVSASPIISVEGT